MLLDGKSEKGQEETMKKLMEERFKWIDEVSTKTAELHNHERQVAFHQETINNFMNERGQTIFNISKLEADVECLKIEKEAILAKYATDPPQQ